MNSQRNVGWMILGYYVPWGPHDTLLTGHDEMAGLDTDRTIHHLLHRKYNEQIRYRGRF